MFLIDSRLSRSEIRSPSEIDPVVRRLQAKGWRALVRHLAGAAAAVAGLADGSVSASQMIPADSFGLRRRTGTAPALGDLFFKDDSALLLQPIRTNIQVWEIRRHDRPSLLEPFCADAADSIRGSIDGRRVRGMDLTWRPVRMSQKSRAASPYPPAELQTQPATVGQEEASRASLLATEEVRLSLRRLAQIGKARAVDQALQSSEAVRSSLIGSNLVRVEYLVSCKQDSHTICTVPDKAVLENAPSSHLRCSTCGRAFHDEQVHEIIAITDSGRSLLEGSRWMTFWLTDILTNAGLSIDQIKWNAILGSDELDISVNLHGLRVFFELKDREFGLGDAYPFAARVNRYGGDYGVVVSADKIADDAKKVLQEQARSGGGPAFVLISSEQSVPAQVSALLDRLSQASVRMHLSQPDNALSGPVLSVLDEWMRRQAR